MTVKIVSSLTRPVGFDDDDPVFVVAGDYTPQWRSYVIFNQALNFMKGHRYRRLYVITASMDGVVLATRVYGSVLRNEPSLNQATYLGCIAAPCVRIERREASLENCQLTRATHRDHMQLFLRAALLNEGWRGVLTNY